MFYLKTLEKEKQIKTLAGGRKKIMEITAEIKKYKTNYTREKKTSQIKLLLRKEKTDRSQLLHLGRMKQFTAIKYSQRKQLEKIE